MDLEQLEEDLISAVKRVAPGRHILTIKLTSILSHVQEVQQPLTEWFEEEGREKIMTKEFV